MEKGRTVLVTGGAGYVGAHACKALAAEGFLPVTFDDLSTGWRDAVKWGPLIKADLLDRDAVARAFKRHEPVAVMHFAALSLVGESMRDPTRYWRVNIDGAMNLIEAARAHRCDNVVFSSTCATYGDQDGVVLDEATPQRPINAYGASKMAIETMLRQAGDAHRLKSMIFRYFNVAGADPDAEIGEQHRPETHLIPLILDAARGRREALAIFGTDYPTPDGTCIRDYVHVADLVDAHVLGLKALLAGAGSDVFCLGSGRGFSVREVISTAEAVTGLQVPLRMEGRRAGDAASLVCGSGRARDVLGWRPRRSDLAVMIEDAWNWALTPGFRDYRE
jgi:UDP-glucose 4-epimerase